MKMNLKALGLMCILATTARLGSMTPPTETHHLLSVKNPTITVTNATEMPIRRVRLKIQYNGAVDTTKAECLEKQFHEKGFVRASGIIEHLATKQSATVNTLTQAFKKLRVQETPAAGEKRVKTLTGSLLKPSECMQRIDDITVLAVVIQDEEQPGQYRKHKVEFGEKEQKRQKKGLHANRYTINKSDTGEFQVKVDDRLYPMKKATKLKTKLPEELLKMVQEQSKK